jgi:hypothetical protein
MLACSLFHRILSVREASNPGTNALPILSQAMAGETECCDLEQLLHFAQSLQSDLRGPLDDLWGPVDV